MIDQYDRYNKTVGSIMNQVKNNFLKFAKNTANNQDESNAMNFTEKNTAATFENINDYWSDLMAFVSK